MASGSLIQTTAFWFREYTLLNSRWKVQITHYHCAVYGADWQPITSLTHFLQRPVSNSSWEPAALTGDFCNLFLVLYVVGEMTISNSSVMQHISSWYRIKHDGMNEKFHYSEDCSYVTLNKIKCPWGHGVIQCFAIWVWADLIDIRHS